MSRHENGSNGPRLTRRARRKFYQAFGPPTFPLFMVAGAWILKSIGHRMPFIKFARPDRFSYHLPPVKSRAYERFYRNIVDRGLGREWGPHAVTIAVTHACNASCAHCSAFRRSWEGTLTTGQWCEVIDQCAELGITDIIITGGEPLLRPDLDVLIRRIVANDCVADIFSNGSLLTEENLERLQQAGCDTIFVSLDSPVREEHDTLRGIPGLYDEAIAGISRAVARGMAMGISTYMSRENIARDYHHRFLEMCRELGVGELTVFDLVPTGRCIKEDNLILTDGEREVFRVIQEEQWRHFGGPRVCLMCHVNDPHIMGCFGVKWQIHITHNGYVTPCDFTPLHFGNVKDESLWDIWHRMKLHPEYDRKAMSCRMQDKEFRRKYIHKIPDGAELPYPIELVNGEHREAPAASRS
ncbi:MAG: radical SAM protein [Actinomycetota bacterium]|nr:radical SAM protein [Actinomycetota bacterium]